MIDTVTFKARFEYLNDKSEVQTIDLTFLAADLDEAYNAPKRWWDARSQVLPDQFATLLYVATYPYYIGEVNDKGHCRSRIGFRLYEWSQDRAGTDWATFIEWALEKRKRNEARRP